jgi:hypothetical protein
MDPMAASLADAGHLPLPDTSSLEYPPVPEGVRASGAQGAR